ncbi:polyamine aminopropyltransferase [Tissierella creatinini]|nr:polyamine aminopropyltransferase [Tissierella creatinini]TJX67276.1 polyamine aminopropyltransferase [Soehngenia saccharolytica]
MELWFSEKNTETCKFSIKVKEQIYSEQTPFQKIAFFESYDFGRFFTLDGLMMVNEKDEFIYHDMIVHVPMAVNPDIKKVLVIGGGDGGTVRELSRYKSIETIHLVDIDERVVRLCQKYLPQTACGFDDPRVKTYFEDGVAFVKKNTSYYDLILVDSTDPIGPGEGLFTKDFYNDCYNALNENGILINQHESPYFENYAKEMKKAHVKLKSIFDVCKVYQFHMPTYASGHWLFGFASKGLDPIKDHRKDKWESLGLKTKYYNSGIHLGAFLLPTYVEEKLNSPD